MQNHLTRDIKPDDNEIDKKDFQAVFGDGNVQWWTELLRVPWRFLVALRSNQPDTQYKYIFDKVNHRLIFDNLMCFNLTVLMRWTEEKTWVAPLLSFSESCFNK